MNETDVIIGAKVKLNDRWNISSSWQLNNNSIIISSILGDLTPTVIVSNTSNRNIINVITKTEQNRYKKIYKDILSESLLPNSMEWPIKYLDIIDIIEFKCKKCCIIDNLFVHLTENYYLCNKCYDKISYDKDYDATMYNKFGEVRKI